MNPGEEKKKKKKKKKKSSATAQHGNPRSSGKESTPIGKVVPEKEEPILAPEGHEEPFELSWRWHVTTLIIIYTSLTLLLYSYIQVIRYYAAKHMQIAQSIETQVASIRKSPGEALKIYKQIFEERKQLDSKMKEVIRLYTDCNINSRSEKMVKPLITPDQLKALLKSIEEEIPKSQALFEKVTREHLRDPELQRYYPKLVQSLERLKSKIRGAIPKVDQDSGEKPLWVVYSSVIGVMSQDFLRIIHEEDKIQGCFNVEEASDMIIARYIQAISDDRRNVKAHALLGEAYIQKSWEDQALEEWIKVIKFDRFKKKYTKETFDKMTALVDVKKRSPIYVDAYFYIAVARLISGNVPLARENLEKLIKTPANSIWKSEARKLKAMIDKGDRKAIKAYLRDQLWV